MYFGRLNLKCNIPISHVLNFSQSCMKFTKGVPCCTLGLLVSNAERVNFCIGSYSSTWLSALLYSCNGLTNTSIMLYSNTVYRDRELLGFLEM